MPIPRCPFSKKATNYVVPMRSHRGSATVTVMIVIVTLVIILGALNVMKRDRADVTLPQAAQQLETHAFYIAQTALDRSIKALVKNPKWRDGFEDIPFESGTYDVKVYDEAGNASDPSAVSDIPPNYVRIVASSEVDGVVREVEAVWVDAMSAFQYAAAAGNTIDIVNHGADKFTFAGDLHNNAWQNGALRIEDGVTLFGNLTSVGAIQIGVGSASEPAAVFGDVWGHEIDLDWQTQIRRIKNLNEWSEGIDLNGDGDTRDTGVDRTQDRLWASSSIRIGDRHLNNNDTDYQIDRGTLPVKIGKTSPGPIVDPRPNFAAYYELVTGRATYPPSTERVVTSIRGDGKGRYFASAASFVEWLSSQEITTVRCWRCAGQGRVDPDRSTTCQTCDGTGEVNAVEITGVFYVDDSVVDLSWITRNLVIHGTIVVAQGNPNRWPRKVVNVPGGSATIDHFPIRGEFTLKGNGRMHFTQTYRSDEQGGMYVWNDRSIGTGNDTQTLSIPEPEGARAMREFPAIIAAKRITIEPKHLGFGEYPGDIGGEALTILQGVVYAEDEVRLHGQGGWTGGTIVFDENVNRRPDDEFNEAVLAMDLNDDGDVVDRVKVSDITTVPVIAVGRDKLNVDLNNNGIFDHVLIGADYNTFFIDNGYKLPTLVHHQGLVLAQAIHLCEQVNVLFDRMIVESGVPFGFEVNFGSTTYQGLVSWQERPLDSVIR